MHSSSNPLLRSVQSNQFPRPQKNKRERPQPPPVRKERSKSPSSESTSNLQPQPMLFVVKYKYHPENEGSGKTTLKINKGDILIVNPDQTVKNGWWYGQKMKTKERGWFPEAYVQR